MSDEQKPLLHWRSEPESVPCVLCGGERKYVADTPAEPRRRSWWRRTEPNPDRCPTCGAR